MKDFHIQWHITEICNLKCKHCYREVWRNELQVDELKTIARKILDFITNLGFESLVLTITGGEPFLKTGFYDLLKYLDDTSTPFDKIKTINIITNGTILPQEKLKTIKKLNKIYISVESLDEKINDFIRGDGSLNKVINNLQYFVDNYNIGIMITLMNCNIDYWITQIRPATHQLFRLGVKEIIFERFIPAGEARKVHQELVAVEKILEFYKKISEVFYVDYDEIKKYPAVKLVRDNNEENVYGAQCVIGKYGFAVLCDATVYPCRRYDTEIFNLLTINGNSYKQIFKLWQNLSCRRKINKKDVYYCHAVEKDLKI